MPGPDQTTRPKLAAVQRDLLRTLAPAEPTLGDVLLAVKALASQIARLEAAVAPRPSPLAVDPEEIARTMAQLRLARPIAKETPP